MPTSVLLATILILSAAGYFLGRRRAVAVSGGHPYSLHSRPQYYGLYVALWCGVPTIFVALAWLLAEPMVADALIRSSLNPEQRSLPPEQLSRLLIDVRTWAAQGAGVADLEPGLRNAVERYASFTLLGKSAIFVLCLVLAIAGIAYARRLISPKLRARNQIERLAHVVMLVASTIAILTTIGIVLSLLFESIRFFARVPFTEFLFGLHWSPQTALRSDQVGASGSFGAIPLFAGTFLITLIAMAVAVPLGLFSAIYMSEYAGPRLRATAKPMLEILAGIPTVVYGFFAALTVAPFFRSFGESLGLDVASESALAAGIVMGVMIIPFVSSLSDDVINAVPQSLRDGAYALGATKSETIRQVIIPAALPGIVGSVLLAVSRAIGETMIVVMAAGLAANLTANPLEAVTTVTVQIVTLLVGDQEFDSAKTLAAFALGLALFAATLCLNVVALSVVRKYREKYD